MAGKLRNIGPKSADWLRVVGICNRDDLIRIGVVPAFAMVRSAGFAPTLNLLWGLEGAARDCDWRTISARRKAELQSELAELDDSEGE